MGRELTSKEWKCINSFEKMPNQGNKSTVCQDVLSAKELKGLRSIIDTHVNEFFNDVYRPKREVKLTITQSWINFTLKDGYHHTHAHQNSFLSGVLYLKASRECDRIYFYKDGVEQLKVYPKEFNTYNSVSWWHETGTGDIILFPSTVTHGVPPVESEERISLSFNTFPVGLLGGHLNSNSLEVIEVGPGNRD